MFSNPDINAGILLICMIELQKETREEVASVFILPCIYSLIGAYPGILQLSTAHEGINCVCCAVLVKYVASSLCKTFLKHADPHRCVLITSALMHCRNTPRFSQDL